MAMSWEEYQRLKLGYVAPEPQYTAEGIPYQDPQAAPPPAQPTADQYAAYEYDQGLAYSTGPAPEAQQAWSPPPEQAAPAPAPEPAPAAAPPETYPAGFPSSGYDANQYRQGNTYSTGTPEAEQVWQEPAPAAPVVENVIENATDYDPGPVRPGVYEQPGALSPSEVRDPLRTQQPADWQMPGTPQFEAQSLYAREGLLPAPPPDPRQRGELTPEERAFFSGGTEPTMAAAPKQTNPLMPFVPPFLRSSVWALDRAAGPTPEEAAYNPRVETQAERAWDSLAENPIPPPLPNSAGQLMPSDVAWNEAVAANRPVGEEWMPPPSVDLGSASEGVGRAVADTLGTGGRALADAAGTVAGAIRDVRLPPAVASALNLGTARSVDPAPPRYQPGQLRDEDPAPVPPSLGDYAGAIGGAVGQTLLSGADRALNDPRVWNVERITAAFLGDAGFPGYQDAARAPGIDAALTSLPGVLQFREYVYDPANEAKINRLLQQGWVGEDGRTFEGPRAVYEEWINSQGVPVQLAAMLLLDPWSYTPPVSRVAKGIGAGANIVGLPGVARVANQVGRVAENPAGAVFNRIRAPKAEVARDAIATREVVGTVTGQFGPAYRAAPGTLPPPPTGSAVNAAPPAAGAGPAVPPGAPPGTLPPPPVAPAAAVPPGAPPVPSSRRRGVQRIRPTMPSGATPTPTGGYVQQVPVPGGGTIRREVTTNNLEFYGPKREVALWARKDGYVIAPSDETGNIRLDNAFYAGADANFARQAAILEAQRPGAGAELMGAQRGRIEDATEAAGGSGRTVPEAGQPATPALINVDEVAPAASLPDVDRIRPPEAADQPAGVTRIPLVNEGAGPRTAPAGAPAAPIPNAQETTPPRWENAPGDMSTTLDRMVRQSPDVFAADRSAATRTSLYVQRRREDAEPILSKTPDDADWKWRNYETLMTERLKYAQAQGTLDTELLRLEIDTDPIVRNADRSPRLDAKGNLRPNRFRLTEDAYEKIALRARAEGVAIPDERMVSPTRRSRPQDPAVPPAAQTPRGGPQDAPQGQPPSPESLFFSPAAAARAAAVRLANQTNAFRARVERATGDAGYALRRVLSGDEIEGTLRSISGPPAPEPRENTWGRLLNTTAIDTEAQQVLNQTVRPGPGLPERTLGAIAGDEVDRLDHIQSILSRGGPANPAEARDLSAFQSRYKLILDDLAESLGGDPEELVRDATPQVLDLLVGIRTAMDLGIQRGTRTAEGVLRDTNLWGQFVDKKSLPLRAIDGYLKFRRHMALYSQANGPAYALTQLAGNAVTLGLARPGALSSYFDPTNWNNAWRGAKDATYKSAPDLTRQRLRLRGKWGGEASNFDQLGGSGFFNQPGASLLRKTAGAVIAPDLWRRLGNVFDTTIRTALHTEAFFRRYGDAARDLPEYVRSSFSGWRTRTIGSGIVFPFNEEAVVRAIDDLRGRTGRNAFNGDDVRDALLKVYDDGAAAAAGRIAMPSRDDWARFADRAGRDWTETLRKIDKDALAEVHRVAFDFDPTVLDSAASRLVMFHFWASRASVLYLSMGLNNPKYLANYGRLWDAIEDQTGEGSMAGFWETMRSPAGYAIFQNGPFALARTWFTFTNEQLNPGTTKTLSGAGQLREASPLAVLMPNPILDAALYAIGTWGEDARTPDVLGLDSTISLITDLYNNWAGKNGRPLRAPDDGRSFTNWLANELTSRGFTIPGGQVVKRTGGSAGFRSQDLYRAMILVAKEDLPPTDPAIQAEVVEKYPEVAGLGPGDFAWDTAYLKVVGTRVSDVLTRDNAYEHDWYQGGMELVTRMTTDPGFQLPFDAGPLDDVLEAAARQWLPMEYRDALADPMSLPGTDMLTGEPVTPEAKAAAAAATPEQVQAREDAGYRMKEIVTNTGPADVARDAAQTFFGDAPWEEFASPEQVWATDSYNAIAQGKVDGAFFAAGRLYTPEALAAMTEEERKAVAMDWMDSYLGAAGWEARQGYYDVQNQYYADNPEVAATQELQRRAEEFPGGEDAFIAALRQANPNYDAWLLGQDDSGYSPVGSQEFRNKALGRDGYAALMGESPSTWDPVSGGPPPGGPLIPGGPGGEVQQVDLATAFQERLAAEEAERAGKGDGPAPTVRQELETEIAPIKARLDALDAERGLPAGSSFNYWIQVAQQEGNRYINDDAVYNIVKDSIAGKDGETYNFPSGWTLEYIVWGQNRAAGEPASPEDWASATGPERRRREREQALAAGEIDPETGEPLPFDPERDILGRTPPPPEAAPNDPANGTPFLTSDALNLRAEPGTAAPVVVVMPAGLGVAATGDPVEADGQLWLPVTLPDGTAGWASGAYLQPAA